MHHPPTESIYHYSVVLPLELDRNDIIAACHLLSLAVFSQHNDWESIHVVACVCSLLLMAERDSTV